jgi:hypothetical protein
MPHVIVDTIEEMPTTRTTFLPSWWQDTIPDDSEVWYVNVYADYAIRDDRDTIEVSRVRYILYPRVSSGSLILT